MRRVYGIATAYAFADATQLIQLNSSVQVSEFHEGFDVKLWVDGPSMTSDTPMRKARKGSQVERLDTKHAVSSG